MPDNNLTTPFFVATSATAGFASSAVSGTLHGINQSGNATSDSMQESSVSERDSLLKALEILCKEPEDLKAGDIAGLDLFPKELENILLATANGVASIASRLSVAPVTAASHLTQLPLDITAAMQGIYGSTQDTQKFLRTKQASSLNMEQELKDKKNDFFANCKALNENFSGIFDKMAEVINGRFDKKFQSHASVAIASAGTMAVATMGTVGLISLLFDTMGSTLRESSALIAFSKQESTNQQENNIYKAFSDCCASLSESKDCRESLKDLQNLEKAISNFNEARNISMNHAATSPAISVLVRLLTSEPFVGTLRLVNSSAIALMAVSDAMIKEREKFSKSLHESPEKASLIKDLSRGDAVNHSQNVMEFFNNFDEVIKRIDNDLLGIEQKSNRGAIAASAKSTAFSTWYPTAVSSLVTGFTGLISREFSGAGDFTTNDQGTDQQSVEVLKTRRGLSGDDLDQLMTRVSALKERLERADALGVSAPVTLGVSHATTSGSITAALNVIAGTCFALRELRSFSENQIVALELNEAEQNKAKKWAASSVESNKDSARTVGTESATANLSLENQLESVMKKIILTHHAQCQSNMERKDINSVAKSSIVSSLNDSTGFLLGALGTIALVSLESGISLEAMLNLSFISLLVSHRSNDGVDKIKTGNDSQFNFSSLSNLTRIIADESADASLAQSVSSATHQAAEVISSRAIIVALCNSGALRELFRRLVHEANVPENPRFSNLTLASAIIMGQLEEQILKVLDDAERNENPIPGLNQDMASQIGSRSKMSIASALSTHCTFISSFLQSSIALKNAYKTDEKEKNEATPVDSIVSKTVSVAMNILQAFTNNCMKEFDKLEEQQAGENQLEKMNTSLCTHISSNQTNAGTLMASCAMSLLCDELLEMTVSRSLSLLDRDKVVNSVELSTQKSEVHSEKSAEAVKADSHCGRSESATQALTALRLTLSRLGIALANFASDLQLQSSDDHHDLLQGDLALHTSQRKLLTCLIPSLTQCASVMLQVSAFLSRSPLSTVATIDETRASIHSLDQELALTRIESSARSTKESNSQTTLLTGISTDLVANTVVNAIKILLKSSILGLDTSLSTAKIMEILSLNPRPDQALFLESQALSQPNDLAKNSFQLAEIMSVGTSIVTASASAETNTCNNSSQSTQASIDAMQKDVDNRIDQCEMLDDEEANTTVGLKKFYELLIRLLAQQGNLRGTDRDYEDIVQRFDRGGMALSSYHSAHGGIPGHQRVGNYNNPLIKHNHFLRCDDAASLLETFIKKAYLDEPNSQRARYETLLDKLKNQLRQPLVLSTKTIERWNYIVNKICDKQRMVDLRMSIIKSADARIQKQYNPERIASLLNNWAAPGADPAVNSSVEIVI